MKKVLFVLILLTVSMGAYAKSDISKKELETFVVRKNGKVQFVKANRVDTTVEILGKRGSSNYIGKLTGTAEEFTYVMTKGQELTDEELLAMYNSPEQALPEKEFDTKKSIIKKATWQSGFFFDKVLLSYKTPIIFRNNMTIYASPASKEAPWPNFFMIGLMVLLLGILVHLYSRLRSRADLREYIANDFGVFVLMFLDFVFSGVFLFVSGGWWLILPIVMFLLRLVILFVAGERYPVMLLWVETIVISALLIQFVALPASIYAVIVATLVGFFGSKQLKKEKEYLVGVWKRASKKENPA